MCATTRFVISCPKCREKVGLLAENTIERIRAKLKWGDVPRTPALNFVCRRCKLAFSWPYEEQKPLEIADGLEAPRGQYIRIVRLGCDGDNCGRGAELIVLHDLNGSEPLPEDEREEWDVSSIRCAKGDRAVHDGSGER